MPTSLDELGQLQFIGDHLITKKIGLNTYSFDAKAHVDSIVNEGNGLLFPVGRPFVQVSYAPRCMAHAVMEVLVVITPTW